MKHPTATLQVTVFGRDGRTQTFTSTLPSGSLIGRARGAGLRLPADDSRFSEAELLVTHRNGAMILRSLAGPILREKGGSLDAEVVLYEGQLVQLRGGAASITVTALAEPPEVLAACWGDRKVILSFLEPGFTLVGDRLVVEPDRRAAAYWISEDGSTFLDQDGLQLQVGDKIGPWVIDLTNYQALDPTGFSVGRVDLTVTQRGRGAQRSYELVVTCGGRKWTRPGRAAQVLYLVQELKQKGYRVAPEEVGDQLKAGPASDRRVAFHDARRSLKSFLAAQALQGELIRFDEASQCYELNLPTDYHLTLVEAP